VFPRESDTVIACPDLPARTTTAMKSPAPLFDAKTNEDELDVPASTPACCTNLMPPDDEFTVKGTPLLATPPTVTTTLPLVAPVGTGTTILVSLQLVGVPAVPLNVTVLVLWVPPKPLPLTVTEVPTTPEAGFTPVMFGGFVIVNRTLLLLIPLIETMTGPVVAPTGTGTTIEVSLQLVVRAVTPLKVMKLVLVPTVGPKFVPVTVTTVPIGPEFGLRLLMFGGGVTLNVTPLLATPLTVTTTFPVVAPEGTGTAMLVSLQEVAVPAVPLKVTVLPP
jgi:hypothetical protein